MDIARLERIRATVSAGGSKLKGQTRSRHRIDTTYCDYWRWGGGLVRWWGRPTEIK